MEFNTFLMHRLRHGLQGQMPWICHAIHYICNCSLRIVDALAEVNRVVLPTRVLVIVLILHSFCKMNELPVTPALHRQAG